MSLFSRVRGHSVPVFFTWRWSLCIFVLNLGFYLRILCFSNMVSCSVPGCEVTRRNNPNQYTFNRFPRNSALFEKWMRIVNRPDWTPSTNSTICSKHF
ncbi:hypothetical protein ABMA27_012158 [Loxostege sticticalis]|uniref:THAP-type domain-containing protein n=1 Tax=Loxostege sticticalis TaxID=481309 RepID=A0ABR3IIX9_LOXSC